MVTLFSITLEAYGTSKPRIRTTSANNPRLHARAQAHSASDRPQKTATTASRATSRDTRMPAQYTRNLFEKCCNNPRLHAGAKDLSASVCQPKRKRLHQGQPQRTPTQCTRNISKKCCNDPRLHTKRRTTPRASVRKSGKRQHRGQPQRMSAQCARNLFEKCCDNLCLHARAKDHSASVRPHKRQ